MFLIKELGFRLAGVINRGVCSHGWQLKRCLRPWWAQGCAPPPALWREAWASHSAWRPSSHQLCYRSCALPGPAPGLSTPQPQRESSDTFPISLLGCCTNPTAQVGETIETYSLPVLEARGWNPGWAGPGPFPSVSAPRGPGFPRLEVASTPTLASSLHGHLPKGHQSHGAGPPHSRVTSSALPTSARTPFSHKVTFGVPGVRTSNTFLGDAAQPTPC